jgi:nucleotide-binding universal stress UspA family protein
MSVGVTRSRILVGVDGSAASDAAVRWAATESVIRKLPITLIHVVAPTPIDSTMAPSGTIPQSRLGQASRGVDAFNGYRLGSVSEALLRHAHCPIAVVHDPESGDQDISDASPVLLGVDGTPASEAATALAFDEACRRQVPLVALHAWSDVGVFPILGMDWHVYRDQGEEVLGERLAGWHERYPDVQVQRRLVCDVPARWLVQESTKAQLVVLGRHGRGGYPVMRLGSVSSAVAQSARVPVIVVPDDQSGD